MKKLDIFFLLCLTMAMALVSCSDDDDNNVPDPIDPVRTYTNTVFVYMPWTGSENSSAGSLTTSFEQNIRDIKSAIAQGKGNVDTRTIVLFASSSRKSRIFEINDDGTETTLDSLSTGAMTTTADLTSLFNKIASISKTKTYSIIIGAHGNGWLPAGSQPYLSRAFGGQSASLQTEVPTLAAAIQQSNIGKMQYISFDDCYMANIETAYALRNATNYLIASTSEIMAAGMPYADVWQSLSSPTPDYAGIVNGFGNYYSVDGTGGGALSVIDCSKAEEMATLMKAFNRKYNEDGQYYQIVLNNIQALDGYGKHVYYDMGSYINDICESDTAGNQQLYSELSAIVPYKFTTTELPTAYYNYNGGYSSYTVHAFSGIAISDPSDNSYAQETKKETEWWKATH